RIAPIDGQWVAFPRYSELEKAVFSMVVAGRIVGDDVAIAMIEAEASDNAWELLQSGVAAPTAEAVAEGLEAGKPFISQLAQAHLVLAEKAAKEPQEVAVFPPYEADAYAAVESKVTADLEAALAIAGKQERENRLEEILEGMHADLDAQFEDRE